MLRLVYPNNINNPRINIEWTHPNSTISFLWEKNIIHSVLVFASPSASCSLEFSISKVSIFSDCSRSVALKTLIPLTSSGAGAASRSCSSSCSRLRFWDSKVRQRSCSSWRKTVVYTILYVIKQVTQHNPFQTSKKIRRKKWLLIAIWVKGGLTKRN